MAFYKLNKYNIGYYNKIKLIIILFNKNNMIHNNNIKNK